MNERKANVSLRTTMSLHINQQVQVYGHRGVLLSVERALDHLTKGQLELVEQGYYPVLLDDKRLVVLSRQTIQPL